MIRFGLPFLRFLLGLGTPFYGCITHIAVCNSYVKWLFIIRKEQKRNQKVLMFKSNLFLKFT